MDESLKLEDIQRQFGQFLYTAKPDRETEKWIGAVVEMYSPREVQSRLQVYRNNLLLTLMSVLRDTYPVVEKILSREVFREMTKD